LYAEEIEDRLREMFKFLRVYSYSFTLGKFPAELPTDEKFSFAHIDLGTLRDVDTVFGWFRKRMDQGGIIAFSGYPTASIQTIVPEVKTTESQVVSYYTC